MDALIEALTAQYGEQHERLRAALTGLSQEQIDWVPAPGTNAIGVLMTHTMASQMDWLHVAVDRRLPRDRDAEFRVSGRDAQTLTRAIDEAAEVAPGLIREAVACGLATMRPRPRNHGQVSVGWVLFHALEHTAEHVGHIELTRQLLAQRDRGGSASPSTPSV